MVLLGHQYLQQLPPRLRTAILGNVGSIVAFQLSGADSDMIAAEIGLKSGDMLTQLAPQEVWAKHATYGGPYTRRLLPSIITHATGREAAVKLEPVAEYASAMESGGEDCEVSDEGEGSEVRG